MTTRYSRILLWSGLGAVLAITGYLLLNTTFMPYDDEGFVLISLRNYLSGLRLYDEVFSQYGPWPYVYHQVITTVAGGVELTHTLGRGITLFHWIAMCLLAGMLAWRLTRSQLAAAVGAILVFGLTWQTTSEPTHPGSHIGLLVALAALLASALPGAKHSLRLYTGLGVVTGLLILTKINVGLLLAAGFGGFILRHTAWPAAWRWLRWLGGAGLLALPWVLMGRQLHFPWALVLAGQFTLGGAGLLWLTPTADTARLPVKALPAAVLAGVTTVAAVCGCVLLRGTTLAALVQTVLINPLRMPAKFIVGTPWYPESLVLAGLGGLAVALAGWEIRQGRALSAKVRWLVAALRMAALAWVAWHVRDWPTHYGIFHFAANCLPLLPLFLVPLSPATAARPPLALWGAAWIALPQVLHGFPVAGSQLAWGTFLCLTLLVAGWWDLGRALPDLLPRGGRHATRAGALLLGLISAAMLALLAFTGWTRYSGSRPLDLPGARDIRLTGQARQVLRLLTLNASIHADLLFSRQGMYSYNLWSGVPTPTAQNATHWFWLLDEKAQQDIIARLRATPRTAFIVSHALDAFMVARNVPMSGPLQDFVTAHYQPLFRYQDFSFEVPAGSSAVAFGGYQLHTSSSTDPTVPSLQFRAYVVLDGNPARIQLEPMESGQKPGPDLLNSRTQVSVEPVNREGITLGPAIRLPHGKPLHGLYRLTVLSPALPPDLPWQDYALSIRGAEGELLSESVYF